MKKQIISFTLLAIGFAAGATVLSALAQTTNWTAPKATPPDGNVDAPITAGGGTAGDIYAQVKTGLLTLANLQFMPAGTNVTTQGLVMTASDTSGDVTWSNIVPNNIITFDYASSVASPSSIESAVTNNGAGLYSWTVPTGVTRISVRAWGAGGQGNANGGGGAGGYAEDIIAVSAGQSCTIQVGYGQAAGGTAGKNSLFTCGNGIEAYGANGNLGGKNNIGTINMNGQNGSQQFAAGGSYVSGGSSPDGGQGGAYAIGEAGSVPGGGGISGNTSGNIPGGLGANGRVVIEY